MVAEAAGGLRGRDDVLALMQSALVHEVAGRYPEAAATMAQAAVQGGPHLVRLELVHCYRQFAYFRSCAALETQAPPLLLHRQAGRPLATALQVSMVKDEADIIGAQLANSYRLGLRYFVIANNASGDATRGEIERFRTEHSDTVVFVVDDPVVAYHQSDKMAALIRLGRSMLAATGVDIDWIFPLDADEFIQSFDPHQDLCDVLERLEAAGQTMLLFFHCDACSPAPLERFVAGDDLAAAFPVVAWFQGGARGRIMSKAMYRFSEDAWLWMGNHYVDRCVARPEMLAPAAEAALLMLHYPFRSRQHVRSKVINGGRAFDGMANPPGGEHWRQRYEAYRLAGEAALDAILTGYIAEVGRRRRLMVRFAAG